MRSGLLALAAAALLLACSGASAQDVLTLGADAPTGTPAPEAVPTGAPAPEAAPAPPVPNAPDCYHTVGANDTISSIGELYNITVEDIGAVNPQIKDLDVIFDEEVVNLPKEGCNFADGAGGKPQEFPTAYDVLYTRAELFLVQQAVEACNVTETLQDPNLVATVMAPSNAAFRSFADDLGVPIEELIYNPDNSDLLCKIISYHALPGVAYLNTEFPDGAELTTLLEGSGVTVKRTKGPKPILQTTSGQGIKPYLREFKGGAAVVHVIGDVMLPKAQ